MIPDPDLDAAAERRDLDSVIRQVADRLEFPGDVEQWDPDAVYAIAERNTRHA